MDLPDETFKSRIRWGLTLPFSTEKLSSCSFPCSQELSVPVPASPFPAVQQILRDTTVWLRPFACNSRGLCHISSWFTDFSGPFFPPCFFLGRQKSPVTLLLTVVEGLAVPAQHRASVSYHKEPLMCLFARQSFGKID